MTLDVQSLESPIWQILSAPGTDLSTISAKRVRRQLLALDPNLSPETLKENKDDVDALISQVFEKVSQNAGGTNSAEGSQAWKREDADDAGMEDGLDVVADTETKEPSPKKKGKKSTEESDAELARKLSNEINSRSRRSGASNGTSANSRKGIKRKSRKSAATVDSDLDEDDDNNNPGGKKKQSRTKRKSTGGAKGGFAKEYILSEPLSAVLQIDKLSRPQVVKALWEYIRGNELQNPNNKREIMCDDGLRAVFNVDKIDMFRMNKVLGQHLHENEG